MVNTHLQFVASCEKDLSALEAELNISEYRLEKISGLILDLEKEIASLTDLAHQQLAHAMSEFNKARAIAAPQIISQAMINTQSLEIKVDMTDILRIKTPSFIKVEDCSCTLPPCTVSLIYAKRSVAKALSLYIQLSQADKSLELIRIEKINQYQGIIEIKAAIQSLKEEILRKR